MPKQQVALELFYDGAWRDLVADDDVRTAMPIVIRRGQGANVTEPRPSQVTAQLANDDDRYRISNPRSPLSGKAGRNTPARVRVGDSVRGTVEVTKWETDQSAYFRRSPRRGSAWCDIEGGGLLERVLGWKETLQSDLYQHTVDEVDDLGGYWSMQDPRGTTAPFSPVAGSSIFLLQGVAFESQQRPPGSGPLADIAVDDLSVFHLTGGTPDSTAGWQYAICAYLVKSTATPEAFTVINLTGLDGSTVQITINVTDGEVVILAGTPGVPGADRINLAESYGDYSWYGKWIMFACKATHSAGTTTISFYWRAVDDPDWQVVDDTYVGTTSAIEYAGASGMPTGSTFGHVTGTVGVASDLISDARFTAFLGHRTETTAARLQRLCTLKGLSCTIIGTLADAHPMGAMPVATFKDHLQEIVTTEDGLLFDAIDDVAIVLLLRNARYAQTPALELVPEDLPRLPKEVTASADVYNVITVSQRDGGEYTTADTTGPLGTQAPPDGVGEERHTINVNVANPNDLPQLANWWLRRGTVDLPKFPTLVIDLNAAPHLIDAVDAMDIGDVLTLTHFREYVIRLYVLGWTERIGTHSRTITMVCAADQQFLVGVYDGTVRRYNTAGSVTVGAYSATFGTITVTRPNASWSSTSVPYQIVIAGEEMRVNSVFDSGANQGLNVTRSINGIVGPIGDAEPVELLNDQRARYALRSSLA